MRILIIQILRMGDALQLVPVIKGIQQLFPLAKIDLLTSTLGAAILNELPEVNETHVFEKENIINHLENGTRGDIREAIDLLRQSLSPVIGREWDWVINFSYSFPSSLLSFMIDTKYRSGMAANPHRQYVAKEEWFQFSLASFMNRRYSNFNWVDTYKNILGLADLPAPPYIIPKNRESEVARQHLKDMGYEGCRIIGMHPGASKGTKMWPVEKFGHLGRLLTKQDDTKILIFGDESSSTLGRILKDQVGDGAEDLTCQTTLESLGAYLANCDLLVTNDTGPMHLASAVGTRVVSLFFSTHFVETGPYGLGHFIIHPNLLCFPCKGTKECFHRDCLDYISPEVVAEVIAHAENGTNDYPVELKSQDRGDIRVLHSVFDPWGNLDWLPVDKRTIALEDIEKMMLKVSWLAYTGKVDATEPQSDQYIQNRIKQQPSDSGNLPNPLVPDIDHYFNNLDAFRSLLSRAVTICFSIQEECLEIKPEQERIDELGKQLSDIETSIEGFDSGTSISFLSELVAVFRENIEQSGPLNLVADTISAYRNIIQLMDILMARIKKLEDTLSLKN